MYVITYKVYVILLMYTKDYTGQSIFVRFDNDRFKMKHHIVFKESFLLICR